MLDRRGQGLPLNTIIISIIVVVVLVVIILIFTGNIGGTNRTLQSCAAQGGSCESTCPDSGRVIQNVKECTDDSKVCCVTI